MCRDEEAKKRAGSQAAAAALLAQLPRVQRKIEMGMPQVGPQHAEAAAEQKQESRGVAIEEEEFEELDENEDDNVADAPPEPLAMRRSFSEEERTQADMAERAAAAAAAAAARAREVAERKELGRMHLSSAFEWRSPQCVRILASKRRPASVASLTSTASSAAASASSDESEWHSAVSHGALRTGVHLIEVEVERGDDDEQCDADEQADAALPFRLGVLPDSIVDFSSSQIEVKPTLEGSRSLNSVCAIVFVF